MDLILGLLLRFELHLFDSLCQERVSFKESLTFIFQLVDFLSEDDLITASLILLLIHYVLQLIKWRIIFLLLTASLLPLLVVIIYLHELLLRALVGITKLLLILTHYLAYNYIKCKRSMLFEFILMQNHFPILNIPKNDFFY